MRLLPKVVALTAITAIIGFDLSTRTQVSRASEQLTLSGIDLKYKTGQMSKVGSALAKLHTLSQEAETSASQPDTVSLPVHGDKVVIDAVASDDPNTLLTDLKELGLQQASIYGSVVSGLLPIDAIPQIAQLHSLQFARPAYGQTNVGLTTSQGILAMQVDAARNIFGVNGAGVTVGVLSDSFNNLGGAAADVASGDLPPGVNVLSDLPSGGIDEGRAMLQLIHDVAPGARKAFHTAFLGEANFANAILRLANEAGAQVIVDDVIYFTEPMFQDGIIARAVDFVVTQGVSYFSSAGNQGRNAYENNFIPSGQFQTGIGELHDFATGPGVDVTQSITVPQGATLTISFQWDSPFFSVSPSSGGSPNDLDIYLVNNSGVIIASSIDANIGRDAVEILQFSNPATSATTQFNLVIARFSGPNPRLMKYVRFGSSNVSVNEFDTASGSSYGHNNANGAEAVGAAPYFRTPRFGVSPAVLELFSSTGPTPILFDLNGNRLPEPEIRAQPDIVAPDGANTTFFQSDVDGDGFPNFFGTSAAAPHAAAVAALMLNAVPGTDPFTIYAILETTALDMNDPGFDFDSGFGLIQADRAVRALLQSSFSVQTMPHR